VTTYFSDSPDQPVEDEPREETPTSQAAPAPDVSEPDLPPPADFDLDSWVQGVRSTIRSVNVYQRADLLGEIDSLEQQLQVARATEASGADESGMEDNLSSEELEARLFDLQQTFVDSGVTFRIEGRSETWLNRVKKEWENHSDTHGKSKDEKSVYVQLHQLAGAIIQPAGVTYEHLAALRESSEPQIRRLLVTFAMANNQAPSVTVPTSPASSATRRGRRR
jgi:hypothetical protein